MYQMKGPIYTASFPTSTSFKLKLNLNINREVNDSNGFVHFGPCMAYFGDD